MFFKTAKFVFFGLLILLAIFSLFSYLPPFKSFYKIRAVMSGSMEKAVPKGSLILNQWMEDKNFKIGDIITYRRPDQKDFFITHRIKAIEKDGLFYFFKTQGDQVPEPDQWRIGQSLIEGKVIFIIPLLGYLYIFVQSLPGFLFLIFLPAAWIIFEEIKNIRKELKKQKNIKIPLFLLTLALFSLQILPTYAYFSSDSVSLTSIGLATKETWADSDPPESSTEILPDSLPQLNFNINFSANDNQSDVAEVKLYYSRDDWGGWIEYGTPQTFSGSKSVSGSFSFNSPLGEGYYRFLTIAKDSLGNLQYDLDKNGISEEDELYPVPANSWTVVDITAPVTALTVNQPMAIANDRIYNGGFENGNLDTWITTGSGNHQATQAASKTGNWSALLGNASSDSLSKNLTLAPEITSTLSFWYRLLTSDNVSGGFFDATVKNGTSEAKVVHDGWDDPTISVTDLGWKNVVYQLNNLVGQNVDLQFKVSQPNDGYKTWVYLDEVRVTAATNSATASSQINLFSHDASGSGVVGIYYQIDAGTVATYSAPLTLDFGTHSLTYFSKDEAGNKEATKSMTINATSSASLDFGVVLNEFLPSGGWVELYNNSTNAVDVNGWKIKNSAGNELVINASQVLSKQKLRIENIAMNKDGDLLILLKPDETKVDSFTYTFSTPGKSFKREPDGTGTWKDPEVTIVPEPTASPSATPGSTVEPTVSPTPEATPEEAQN